MNKNGMVWSVVGLYFFSLIQIVPLLNQPAASPYSSPGLDKLWQALNYLIFSALCLAVSWLTRSATAEPGTLVVERLINALGPPRER